MNCPNCGNSIADGSTNCFSCGSPLSAPTQTQNNDSSVDMGIAVPQDFKLAGDNDSTLGSDLPDAMNKILEDKEPPKEEKKKKKRKSGLLKRVIRTLIELAIIIGIVIFVYNVYCSYTEEEYDLICNGSSTQDGIVTEHQLNIVLSSNRHVNTFEKFTIYNENSMPLTKSDLEAYLNLLGNTVYDKHGEIEDGKAVLTYYFSYYDYSSVNTFSNEFKMKGYNCKIPEKNEGIRIPFIKP